MQNISKTEFKKMHASNQLLLLGAPQLTKEATADVIAAAIKTGTQPIGGKPTTSFGFIDDRHHKVYRDGDFIYLERIEQGDDWKKTSSHKPETFTVVYRVKGEK